MSDSTFITEKSKGIKISTKDQSLSAMNTYGKSLRFSKFVHAFFKNDIVCLYHSLTHQTYYLEKKYYNTLSDSSIRLISVENTIGNDISLLIDSGFIVSDAYEENRIINTIADKFLQRPVINIVNLLLTDKCNLACKYCYIENCLSNSHKFTFMTEEIIKLALRKFADQLNSTNRSTSNPEIILYGGEPLLNTRGVVSIVNEVKRMKTGGVLSADTKIRLITNGTYLPEEIIDCIVMNKDLINVSFSIDGPKDVHDFNRIYHNGSGSFDEIIKNYHTLKMHQVNVGISCTINEKNLPILESVVDWMISDLKIKGFGFNLLIDTPDKLQLGKDYSYRATEMMIKCFKRCRILGIYEDRIMRKAKAFVNKTLHLVDCAGYGNQFVVDPIGRIGSCQAYVTTKKNFPTTVFNKNFDFQNDPVFLKWSQRSPFNMNRCHDCFAIGMCGGGCAYNSEIRQGDMHIPDENFCIHTKTICEWLVWDLYEIQQKNSMEV